MRLDLLNPGTFDTGDKILVRVPVPVTSQANKKIIRIVQKFLKQNVDVLVYPTISGSLSLIDADGSVEVLVEYELPTVQVATDPAIVTLDCRKYSFKADQQLLWVPSFQPTAEQLKSFDKVVEEWAKPAHFETVAHHF